MNNDLTLNGCSVLVVDDDFYLAEDAREALEEAGAVVLGPYGREDDALSSLEEQLPDYAILDLNLGTGPSFTIPRALITRNVPIILMTGYDTKIIPPDLADAPCLQKPVSKAKLIASVDALRGSAAAHRD